FGHAPSHLCGMISHMAAQLPVADGLALAHVLRREKKAVLTFCGDGATSEGDFHEALNVASVWNLPVIFLIENNGYAISTPLSEQVNFKSFKVKGTAYGIEAHSVDGNNVLSVYRAVRKAAEKLRKRPKPVLIEARTYRMRGHEESSGTAYMDADELKAGQERDPLNQYEGLLLKRGVLTADQLLEMREELTRHIAQSFDEAQAMPEPHYHAHEELADVYLPHYSFDTDENTHSLSEKRMVDALREALAQSLEKHPELVLMGQDVAEYGGVFKVTEGLAAQYGKERVRNTPLCESAIVGMSLGLAAEGMKSVVEMQFADFVSSGFNQVVNNLAKSHYRWGLPADTVIRLPTGAGTGAGPFHSQSTEAWFFRVPGLKIVYPSTPREAKGLLCAAIDDPNPVLFFEHKKLYRSTAELVSDDRYTLQLGKARVVEPGDELSLITYGLGVHWALEILPDFAGRLEIVDLRTLQPWDRATVSLSVQKTGKVLVLHEDNLTGGIGAEIAAWIGEHLFEKLDAPVMRLGSADTPVPFNKQLENGYLAQSQLKSKVEQLLAY
ncbi:MAG: dehydrogenase, partial [Cytophagales bacterium]|nr:dehydrogenase [Cytophagales bacterium]